jgi:TPR repeat protein
MDADGKRLHDVTGVANYKRAVRWLSLAAGHGLPAAWYALSKIYQKPECAHRSPAEARRCIEKAAAAGYGKAQLELGVTLWRARREHASNDVLAVAWLLKAKASGIAEAAALLERIAVRAAPAYWAKVILQRLSRAAADRNPLLVARVELAACFGLSRAEALLIDPKAADGGHCLVVDVRSLHPHCKRRLILVQTAQERSTLDRITAMFERVEGGAEGNYRQRLYRLKTLA